MFHSAGASGLSLADRGRRASAPFPSAGVREAGQQTSLRAESGRTGGGGHCLPKEAARALGDRQ